MLLLSNEDISEILTMSDVVEVLEDAYGEKGNGNAENIPRTDLLIPASGEGEVYGFKTMSGTIPKFGVTALRINSDIVSWPEFEGVKRRVKVPLAPPDGRWVGLVILFSNSTGEPLAIFPDGVVQRMRVAGTSGLAAKYLARGNAGTVAVFGSGWQAGAHVMAMANVCPVKQFKVYSPNLENRIRFAAEMGEQTGIDVKPVNTAQTAAEGADILVAATNALGTVIKAEFIQQGTHVTCVRPHEIESTAYDMCDIIVVNSRHDKPIHYYIKLDPKKIPEIADGWENPDVQNKQWENMPELCDLVTGKVNGRTSDDQITCFNNNIGLGFQFAAVGARVLGLAKVKGIGRELPAEWFTQTVHP